MSAREHAEVPEQGVVVGRARSAAQLMASVDPAITATEEQRGVIEAGLEPMLVVAGAGSGKTATLSMRIVYLLDHAQRLFGTPISPEEILCLTFTRKAAAEIAERAEARIAAVFGGDPARPPVSVSTYNAYAAQLVAEHGLRLGVDPDATTLTQAALWQLADSVVSAWTADLDVDSALSTLTAAIPRLAAQLRDHEATPRALRAWAREALAFATALPGKGTGDEPGPLVTRNGTPNAHAKSLTRLRTLAGLADLVEEFQRRKRAASQLDFADQVGYAVELSHLTAVKAIERGRYRAILLDEFQDTSPGQLSLFARLFAGSHHVMAVGDPNQAIYGFRGASESALSMFVDAFGGAEVVSEASLSVSWRNERAVLDIANAAVRPLRDGSKVDVRPLRSQGEELGRPEPVRAAPGVESLVAPDHLDEASAVVRWLGERLQQLRAAKPDATAAVLCRRKAQFGPVVEALADAGIDYEVVGLGGLVHTPEVADLVALLEIAHDPSRGDSAMRLLTSERMAMGIADLAALHDWAEELGGPRDQREAEAGIVDAISTPPPAGWMSRHGRSLGVVARGRLAALHHAIDGILTRTYLPLTELILTAERLWGLDIEAAVARPDGRAARNVDAFIDAARQFAAGADHVTLGAFLAWLDAARDEESGLELPVKEPEPGAVQVLTVHASKGLEWDVVAVPGLIDGHFPSVDAPTPTRDWYSDGGWYAGRGIELPYELRLDRADLPHWYWRESIDQASFAESLVDFRRDCGEHRVAEERRLFYVAVTRARSHVLLSASWFTEGITPRQPSCYLVELVEHGLLDRSTWAPRPDPDARLERSAESRPWPPLSTPAQLARRELAARVRDHREREVAPAPWHELPQGTRVHAMLAERALRHASTGEVHTPAHLSTSALVALRRDRQSFAAHLRRPLPAQPTDAARRGSLIHAWIESRYGHTPLLEIGDLGPGEDESAIDELKAAFEASAWHARTPSHIEVDVEVPLAGVTIRSRIDAVFPAGDGLDRVTVVDWKSGAEPADPAERAAREVQLSVYRLAWSTWTGVPLADVDAAFHYVRDGRTVFPQRLLSREEIEALIRGTA